MAVQPTGTVTLLFTDIEGSTQLLQKVGTNRYAEALDLHRRLLRAAFEAHDGYEVDCEGDAFFVAFARAEDAVAAAGEAQQALAGAAWPEGAELRVRMGVHSGEPLAVPPNYVGMDVHRVARIMAAGHGGQVLVSPATVGLLDGIVPLRDLGEHRLKDLTSPQRLYQLGGREFPALRTLYRTNLPVPATVFLGRERELAELSGVLRQGVRLLTLTGPGGTGKTRLALQAVGELANEFPDGVWWVPLAGLHDPALLLTEIAQTLGIVEEPGRDSGDTLRVALTGKRVALLLDNAEHLLPEIVPPLGVLRSIDGPAVVVTSRERLQLAGERVYAVPPLSENDGVQLFNERVSELGLPATDAGIVEELCARLDSLPLAIELAAARTAVLAPREILRRLSERLDLLTAGRDADPRQQTLRATIEWSHDLLEPPERELFARLSVITGGCTLEAIEEICVGSLDPLASLVEKSLVRHSDGRYSMLETVREYAGERLAESGQASTTRQRHAAFFEALATTGEQALHTADQVSWQRRLDAEQPNLRSALTWSLENDDPDRMLRIAAALFLFWEARGPAEGRIWLERALGTGAGSPTERAKAYYAAGRLAFFQGDLRDATTLLPEAIRLARLAEDSETLAIALGYYGWVLQEQGESALAYPLTNESRSLARDVTDPWVRTEILVSVASVLNFQGDYAGATTLETEILAVRRGLGDERAIADALNNLGYGALLAGNYRQASELLDESLALARHVNDEFRITLALGNLGLLAIFQNRYQDALTLAEENLTLCVGRGDRRNGPEAVLALASAHAALGNAQLAVKLSAARQANDNATGLVHHEIVIERTRHHIDHARQSLDDETVARLTEEGSRMTIAQVLTELTAARQ